MQQIQSWRTNGGDITATPHLRKPIAMLNNDLYTIQESKSDGTMGIRITTAPHQNKSLHSSKLMISPEAQSDIDIRNDVMLENRSDVYDSTQRIIWPESILTESGDDEKIRNILIKRGFF
jgi:hypothetical protein